MQIISINFN